MSALGKSLIASLDADDLAELRHLLGLDTEPETATAAPVPTEPLLTPTAAAERVGAHPETVRRAIRRGALPAVRVGRSWRIRPDDLDRWLTPPTEARQSPRRASRPLARSGSRRPMADALAKLDPIYTP